jgi:hypothetical protein
MSEQIESNGETYITANEFQQQLAEEESWDEGPLKELLVEYVGSLKEEEEVTVDMIVETMAKEFPEFLMLIAEENWIRGYQQAIHDVDEGQKLLDEHASENDA